MFNEFQGYIIVNSRLNVQTLINASDSSLNDMIKNNNYNKKMLQGQFKSNCVDGTEYSGQRIKIILEPGGY